MDTYIYTCWILLCLAAVERCPSLESRFYYYQHWCCCACSCKLLVWTKQEWVRLITMAITIWVHNVFACCSINWSQWSSFDLSARCKRWCSSTVESALVLGFTARASVLPSKAWHETNKKTIKQLLNIRKSCQTTKKTNEKCGIVERRMAFIIGCRKWCQLWQKWHTRPARRSGHSRSGTPGTGPYIHTCIYIYIHIYVYTSMYIYIYIYTHI